MLLEGNLGKTEVCLYTNVGILPDILSAKKAYTPTLTHPYDT